MSRRVITFGVFQADLISRELRKNGAKIRLQDQPFQVLAVLLQNAGNAVTREELRQKLWSTDTFVDFDNGLNTTINKIREALGDSAENPRFVETLPRRGYRFIAPVAGEVAAPSPADLASSPIARPARQRQLWLASGATGLFALATTVLAFLYLHQKPAARPVIRFEVTPPEQVTAVGSFALSPDGSKLAFIGADGNGRTHLWVRSFDTLESRTLEGTDEVYGFPFWSPDSRFIVFAAPGGLKKIDSFGGPPVTLCEGEHFWGGSWNGEDRIIFGSDSGTEEVPASGGSPSPVTRGAQNVTPSFLPDGRHFIYLRIGIGLYLGSLASKPEDQPSKKLVAADSNVLFTRSSDPDLGYLLFVRGTTGAGTLGTLVAQPFDTRRLELAGQAVPVREHIPNVGFSASATGTLVYVSQPTAVLSTGTSGSVQGQLEWFGRDGKSLGRFGDPGIYRSLALSPDDKHVVFERSGSLNPGTYSLWLYDFERGVTTRFTSDAHWDALPAWSPDGSQIAFGSNRNGTFDLYQKDSNLASGQQLLLKSSESKGPTNWSPDGRFLLFSTLDTPSRLWLLPIGQAQGAKPVPVENSEFNEIAGRFSPDGRWLSYQSDESGKYEIYVRAFDAAAAPEPANTSDAIPRGKWMVSSDGGVDALWRRDGRELFYLSPDGAAMSVEVRAGRTFHAGTPKRLFKVPNGVLFWDVSSDGKRFLMAAPPSTPTMSAQPPFIVVLNWQSALPR